MIRCKQWMSICVIRIILSCIPFFNYRIAGKIQKQTGIFIEDLFANLIYSIFLYDLLNHQICTQSQAATSFRSGIKLRHIIHRKICNILFRREHLPCFIRTKFSYSHPYRNIKLLLGIILTSCLILHIYPSADCYFSRHIRYVYPCLKIHCIAPKIECVLHL